MDEQFITDVVQNAMSFDGLTRSRPMNINVTTPDEIKQLFDAIAYQKGTITMFILTPIDKMIIDFSSGFYSYHLINIITCSRCQCNKNVLECFGRTYFP